MLAVLPLCAAFAPCGPRDGAGAQLASDGRSDEGGAPSEGDENTPPLWQRLAQQRQCGGGAACAPTACCTARASMSHSSLNYEPDESPPAHGSSNGRPEIAPPRRAEDDAGDVLTRLASALLL